MVREASVNRVEDVGRLAPEDFFRVEVCHSVGEVHSNLEVRPVLLELEEEIQIVLMDVLLIYLPFLRRRDAGLALINPLLDGSESGVESYCRCVCRRDFHSVVLRRVV